MFQTPWGLCSEGKKSYSLARRDGESLSEYLQVVNCSKLLGSFERGKEKLQVGAQHVDHIIGGDDAGQDTLIIDDGKR